jgi:hypothetical protein
MFEMTLSISESGKKTNDSGEASTKDYMPVIVLRRDKGRKYFLCVIGRGKEPSRSGTQVALVH